MGSAGWAKSYHCSYSFVVVIPRVGPEYLSLWFVGDSQVAGREAVKAAKAVLHSGDLKLKEADSVEEGMVCVAHLPQSTIQHSHFQRFLELGM
jgi:hypothetical protein